MYVYVAGYTEQRFPSFLFEQWSSLHLFSFQEMIFPLLVPGLFFLSFMVLAMYRVHSSMCMQGQMYMRCFFSLLEVYTGKKESTEKNSISSSLLNFIPKACIHGLHCIHYGHCLHCLHCTHCLHCHRFHGLSILIVLTAFMHSLSSLLSLSSLSSLL